MTKHDLPTEIKSLREDARIGLREMARELGMSPNGYRHYEQPERFKDPYLPMDLALRMAKVFEDKGADPAPILSLAGPADAQSTHTESVAERYRRLSPKRQRLVEALLTAMEEAEAAGPENPRSATDDPREDPEISQ